MPDNEEVAPEQLPSDGTEVDPGVPAPTEEQELQYLKDNGWDG